MDEEKTRILLDLLILASIVITICFFTVFIITVYTEGGTCVLNPGDYYAKVNNISNICDHCTFKWQYK